MIYNIGYRDILEENADKVILGSNKILISYYLKDSLICNKEHIEYLRTKKDEVDNAIKEYLVPLYAKGRDSESSYIDFYKYNIENDIKFIKDRSESDE